MSRADPLCAAAQAHAAAVETCGAQATRGQPLRREQDAKTRRAPPAAGQASRSLPALGRASCKLRAVGRFKAPVQGRSPKHKGSSRKCQAPAPSASARAVQVCKPQAA